MPFPETEADMSPPLLQAIDLTRRYDKLVAVDSVSFSIEAGSCVGILGPNGAGKTTTVEMLEGLVPPSSGEVRFRGQILTKQHTELAGIMFQSTALQDYMTVREALTMFGRFYEESVPVDTLVEQCALEDFLDQDSRKVSGGQRQRLLLAIALVNNPTVLFLDEPTTGLDPDARQRFWQLIQTIQSAGKTIVLTTHYMEEARVLCDELMFMHKGTILTQGSPETLLSERFDDTRLRLPSGALAALSTSLHETFSQSQLTQDESMTTITTADVNTLLAYLVEQGVDLTHLDISKRTLDDLFMSLAAEGSAS